MHCEQFVGSLETVTHNLWVDAHVYATLSGRNTQVGVHMSIWIENATPVALTSTQGQSQLLIIQTQPFTK